MYALASACHLIEDTDNPLLDIYTELYSYLEAKLEPTPTDIIDLTPEETDINEDNNLDDDTTIDDPNKFEKNLLNRAKLRQENYFKELAKQGLERVGSFVEYRAEPDLLYKPLIERHIGETLQQQSNILEDLEIEVNGIINNDINDEVMLQSLLDVL